MSTGEPIDLIRIEGEGSSVILRITGKDEVLVGEFVIDTSFVRGTIKTALFPEDLRAWRDSLDAFDLQGEDIAWREGSRATELFIERVEDDPQQRVNVTLRDHSMSMTTVTVMIPLADSWFDDAYERLDLVWKTWAPADS